MSDFAQIVGAAPLSKFYAALSQYDKVKAAVREQFGSESEAVLDSMRNENISSEQADALHDLLADMLNEQGEAVRSFVGRGDFDEFSIDVMQFGPLFWIIADEFDDIGYFDDLVKASDEAKSNYEPFITYATEYSDENA